MPHRRRRPSRFFRPILRPFAGRRLPRELRVRRVDRLAGPEKMPEGVRDPAFEALLERIDGAPVLGGNQVEVYFSGREAFAAMREAVLAAKHEILLESYIFKDDTIGRGALDNLAAAAERGVTVRVIADAMGSFETRDEFWEEMRRRGIEVHLFHPLFSKIWYQPFRDHRKILVVDREVGFTGGMNIGEEYGSPFARPGETWRDSHVRVTGPAVWEMTVVFQESWVRAGGEPFEVEPLLASSADVPGARILTLDSRPKRGQAESASVLAAIAAAARRTLWITNAYFAPGHAALKVLGKAAWRGVDVRLLLPGKTDVPIVRHAGHGFYLDLLERGVRVFEFEPSILHAKTLVADGYVSVVGSTNLDFRSFLFNAECDLVILDPDTAGKLEAAFLADQAQAREVLLEDWRNRPLLHRLGDRLARLLAPVL